MWLNYYLSFDKNIRSSFKTIFKSGLKAVFTQNLDLDLRIFKNNLNKLFKLVGWS